jgi:hypothetical protein
MTRFELVMTRRVRETHSVGVDGALGPLRSRLETETVDEIICSWCGDGDRIEALGPAGTDR